MISSFHFCICISVRMGSLICWIIHKISSPPPARSSAVFHVEENQEPMNQEPMEKVQLSFTSGLMFLRERYRWCGAGGPQLFAADSLTLLHNDLHRLLSLYIWQSLSGRPLSGRRILSTPHICMYVPLLFFKHEIHHEIPFISLCSTVAQPDNIKISPSSNIQAGLTPFLSAIS